MCGGAGGKNIQTPYFQLREIYSTKSLPTVSLLCNNRTPTQYPWISCSSSPLLLFSPPFDPQLLWDQLFNILPRSEVTGPCLSVPGLLQLASWYLVPSSPLQMTEFHSFFFKAVSEKLPDPKPSGHGGDFQHQEHLLSLYSVAKCLKNTAKNVS